MGGPTPTEAMQYKPAETIIVTRQDQDQRQRNANWSQTAENVNQTLAMQHQQTNNRGHVVSPPLQGMQISASINGTATIGARNESYSESKKRREREKAFAAAKNEWNTARSMERHGHRRRTQTYALRHDDNIQVKNHDLRREKRIMLQRFKAIDAELEARLLAREDSEDASLNSPDYKSSHFHTLKKERLNARRMDADAPEDRQLNAKDVKERRTLRIRYESVMKKIDSIDEYMKFLQEDSEEMREMRDLKETLTVQSGELRRLRKTLGLEDEERKRELKTISRHARFNMLQRIFRKDNPYSHEGKTVTNPLTGNVLKNIGRATMGGTKPMYLYQDTVDGTTWLFKEPINCIGFSKPGGALVTEAAAKLQQKICGDNASIPAFCLIEKGKVMGSFQLMKQSYKGPEKADDPPRIDLYKWQAARQSHPETDADGDGAPGGKISDDVKNSLLREHVLDWILCNFDTKGENFLQQTDGTLCSFDKEASFNFMNDTKSQTMDETYKPHSNDTIYNTIFKDFAAGKIKLDLTQVFSHLDKVEQMGKDAYIAMFDKMLTHKYGKDSAKYRKAADAMWARVTNAKNQYRTFFEKLLIEREKITGADEAGQYRQQLTQLLGPLPAEIEKQAQEQAAQAEARARKTQEQEQGQDQPQEQEQEQT